MRLRAALFTYLLGYGPALAQPAQASPTPAPPAPASPAEDPTLQARRHFQSGLKLYRDANYAGALAEFEAAYQLKPGASSLQNVALSQKALFRYGEAADTLKVLLERHASELSEDEQRAIKLAIDELSTLTGSVLINVQPPAARVTLNGQPVEPDQRGKRLRVNVGEYTVAAEAPGYARATRTLRVAGGQNDIPVELSLTPTDGFLEVVVDDPLAVVAVDGKPLARQHWTGPLSADEEHLVQVYRDGYEPFEKAVTLTVGKTLLLKAALGARVEGEETGIDVEGKELPLPPGNKGPLGWYGLFTLGVLGTGAAPLDFDVENARADSTAGTLGLRGGYRFWKSIAVDLMIDLGNLQVTDACDADRTAAAGATCGKEGQINREYQLRWIRIGPNLRFMSSGEHVRFIAGAGTGIVHHTLELEPLPGLAPGGTARGVDPYFLLEAGIGFNFGHWLVEAAALAMIDGTGALNGDLDEDSGTVFSQTDSTLPVAGLSLRFGWSQWRPR